MFELAPLLLAFPVAGLLINLLFGKRMDERWIGIVGSAASGLAFAIALLLAGALAGNAFHGEAVRLADWITIGELQVAWQMRVDTLSVTMMLLVTGVGTLIHIYAIGYMHGDARFQRFFIYLNFFITAMLVLVSGDNYLMLFVGWEGVGLASYLLIGFWFDREGDGVANARAGRKAFVVNRIGDFGFLIAVFLIFWNVRSLEFEAVFAWFEHAGAAVGGLATVVTLLMLVGVTGKSAQIPLFVWLPDAMAGPTPVSALIHAATMVTAGVYLVARSGAIFELAPVSQTVVALVGAGTAFVAGTIALAQWDIKRVLAYSTISQLGFMVAAVGLGGYVAGMFHLLTHGFFKALLFLSAGSVIHGVEHGEAAASRGAALEVSGEDRPTGAHEVPDHVDAQDMRVMGGLRHRMKTTFAVYVIGALALAGVFPLAGFWSKDEILADAWQVGSSGALHGWIVYGLLVVAAFFTAFYMARQIFLVFYGEPRSAAAKHAHENPAMMTVPLIALAALSVVGGALNLPGLETLGTWLEHTSEVFHTLDFNLSVAISSTVIALGAIGLGYFIYYRKPLANADAPDQLQGALGPVFSFLNAKWYVDELYGLLVIRSYEWQARFLAFTVDWRFWHDFAHDKIIAGGFRGGAGLLSGPVDKGIIDRFFDALAHLMRLIAARVLRPIQTGFVRNYALGVLLGVVVLLGYFLTR
ncbi:MAG: NADH-quinone oxidoreductase subunit L [Anaerolineales bacterium]